MALKSASPTAARCCRQRCRSDCSIRWSACGLRRPRATRRDPWRPGHRHPARRSGEARRRCAAPRLGLYVVRMIADLHRGEARARNLADGSGVEFTLVLRGMPRRPLAGTLNLSPWTAGMECRSNFRRSHGWRPSRPGLRGSLSTIHGLRDTRAPARRVSRKCRSNFRLPIFTARPRCRCNVRVCRCGWRAYARRPMDVRRFLAACVFTGATLFAAGSAPAGGLDDFIGVWDAPSRYFPGKYFEQKAQFYLKKQDYATALRMFELSGYWADKVAQYNAGIMHFNGIGVPIDKILGTAWLGIAAEAHDNLADQALQAAYAELTRSSAARPTRHSSSSTKSTAMTSRCRGHCGAIRRTRRSACSVSATSVPVPWTPVPAATGCTNENSVNFARRMDSATQRADRPDHRPCFGRRDAAARSAGRGEAARIAKGAGRSRHALTAAIRWRLAPDSLLSLGTRTTFNPFASERRLRAASEVETSVSLDFGAARLRLRANGIESPAGSFAFCTRDCNNATSLAIVRCRAS